MDFFPAGYYNKADEIVAAYRLRKGRNGYDTKGNAVPCGSYAALGVCNMAGYREAVRGGNPVSDGFRLHTAHLYKEGEGCLRRPREYLYGCGISARLQCDAGKDRGDKAGALRRLQ